MGEGPVPQGVKKAALVSLPPLHFGMPSIQIGALKAFVNRRLPEIEVVCHHLHLEVLRYISPRIAAILSEAAYISEGVNYLVFEALRGLSPPDREQRIQRLGRELAKLTGDGVELVQDLVTPLKRFYETQATVIATSGYEVVGISLGPFCVFSCVNLATLIKASAPETRIILGGSGLTPNLSRSLIGTYDWIDFVCFGEGETALAKYLADLAARNVSPAATPAEQECRGTNGQIDDLEELPTPDYQEYMNAVGHEDFASFAPHLVFPVEGSRGCWYQSARRAGGCRFCALNLQWSGYRLKSLERQTAELAELADRYGVRRFLFVDNVVPARVLEGLATAVEDLSVKVVMMETRPDLTEATIEKVARMGVSRFFLGIEALDGESLRRMNKGVSPIQNIYMMKLLEQHNVSSSACLILNIPGTTAAALRELSYVLDCVRAYRPLYINHFVLQEGSAFHRELLAQPGYDDGNNQHYWSYLPDEVNAKISFVERYYRGPLEEDPEYAECFAGVRSKVKDWSRHYWEVKRRKGVSLLLWLDAHSRIHDLRFERATSYDLSPTQRDLFRAVHHPRSAKELKAEYGEGTVDEFVHEMQSRKLVFVEDDRVLGLPIEFDGAGASDRYLEVLRGLFATATTGSDSTPTPPPSPPASPF